MDSKHPAMASGAIQTTRTIFHTGVWAGQYLKRHLTTPWTGVCVVCNNLQPLNHEDTLGKTPSSAGRWTRFQGRQPMTDLVKEPALYIPDIKTKELLRARDIDPKTGKAYRDCRYCRLLCDVLDQFFVDEWMSWVTDTRNGMYLDVSLMIRRGAPLVINCSGSFVYDPKVMYPRADLEIFCETAEELGVPGVPVMGLTLPRVKDTREPSCMKFAKGCIDECVNAHSACSRSRPDFLPTRLLVVGPDEGHVRLSCSPLASTRWAALSHCWGEAKPLKLLKSNIEDLKKNINVSDLPPTFQNAVKVCRDLAIDHLWIDSLCIIQDDSTDWQQQAAQMGTIYNQAFLTIIGASSSNPEQPFLGPRNDEDWGTKTIEFETPSGARVPIKARRRHLLAAPLDYGEHDPPFTETWATLKREGPLYKRSWCFQESYLASRALHFAPGALIFECNTHRRSDDTPKTYSLANPVSLGQMTDETKWRMIVKSYTSRQLTYASDKLPAISGIASLIPQASTDEYLAGLWRKSLLYDLLWQVMACNGRTAMLMTYPPEQQKAPSWSWASLNHGVLWNQFNSFEPLATVIDASCIVDGLNPFGAVSSGHVKLTGRMRPCTVTHDRQKGQHHAYIAKTDGVKSKPQWFMGDGMLVPMDNGSSKTVAQRRTPSMQDPNYGDWQAEAFFFCIARTGLMHFDHVGLVLAISEKVPGSMERIGSITNVPKDWFESASEHTIILV